MSIIAAVIATTTFTCAMERVDSMDPIRSQSTYDSKAIQLVYETPLGIDYVARPYKLIPGLCELPEVSSNGLEYVFRMAPDSPFRADDVKRSIERLRDRSNPSPGGWTMKRVESVDVTPEGALRVRLSVRQHVFPWMMAMSYCAVRNPDGSGTGPYTLKSWWRNHEMVFVRNPSWRGWAKVAARDEAEGLAPFDEVRYLVVDDLSTQWLMFLSGQLDFLASIARDNWSAVMDADGRLDPRLSAAGVTLSGGDPAMEIRYLAMNMEDATLGRNKKLRQALSCAFDFPTWSLFYNNSIVPAYGPVPPGVDGAVTTQGPYFFNLEKARRLLAEAGYPGGIDSSTGRRLVLSLSIGRPTQDSREAGELVASFFEKIGVRLELDFKTWEAFLGSVSRGDVQMFMMAWVGDYPDAENFLQLFYSANRSPGPNHSKYSNAEFDAEYDAAMAAGDPEERRAHWRRCQEIVREDCPWIFTHITRSFSLSGPKVLGYVPGDFPYGCERHLRTRK